MAHYPTTLGAGSLRASIAKWLKRRYRLPAIDPDAQIIPVNGSREALFSIAQAVIDPSRLHPRRGVPESFLSDLRRRGVARRRHASFPQYAARE